MFNWVYRVIGRGWVGNILLRLHSVVVAAVNYLNNTISEIENSNAGDRVVPSLVTLKQALEAIAEAIAKLLELFGVEVEAAPQSQSLDDALDNLRNALKSSK